LKGRDETGPDPSVPTRPAGERKSPLQPEVAWRLDRSSGCPHACRVISRHDHETTLESLRDEPHPIAGCQRRPQFRCASGPEDHAVLTIGRTDDLEASAAGWASALRGRRRNRPTSRSERRSVPRCSWCSPCSGRCGAPAVPTTKTTRRATEPTGPTGRRTTRMINTVPASSPIEARTS